MKLVIELVPSTAWHRNLAKLLPKSKWAQLKDEVFTKEGKQCYICGSDKGPLSLHEFWEYDDKTSIQKLSSFHHLCNLCHKVKHIGLWCHTEYGRTQLEQEDLSREDLIRHFCTVNSCTERDFL
ncbi:HNH endonuclease, partial [Candidatus Bathyarchaeota archaeon]|nr:HNH endonuclease [Candidatus Bathyarchaeota archaeon]